MSDRVVWTKWLTDEFEPNRGPRQLLDRPWIEGLRILERGLRDQVWLMHRTTLAVRNSDRWQSSKDLIAGCFIGVLSLSSFWHMQCQHCPPVIRCGRDALPCLHDDRPIGDRTQRQRRLLQIVGGEFLVL